MAKGFGLKPSLTLGYALVLLPEANAYAAKLSIDDGSGEEFIGVTNMLKSAQVWKTQKQAKQAIVKYANFIEERLQGSTEVDIAIKVVKRSGDGKLNSELVETLFITPGELESY